MTPGYRFERYADLLDALALKHQNYGLGHDGDIGDGGDSTLVWESKAEAEDDEGTQAVGVIRKVER